MPAHQPDRRNYPRPIPAIVEGPALVKAEPFLILGLYALSLLDTALVSLVQC